MQFTNRLGLKKPDLDDAYNVNDFNENYQKISEAFAGVPEETSGFKTIDDFIGSGAAIDKKRGDTVSIDIALSLMNFLRREFLLSENSVEFILIFSLLSLGIVLSSLYSPSIRDKICSML